MSDVAISTAPAGRSRVKTTRAPNEIDFWRGIALVSIFMNHIPGLWYEQFTHKNFGYTDSAELFVLLAGWSLRILCVCGVFSVFYIVKNKTSKTNT